MDVAVQVAAMLALLSLSTMLLTVARLAAQKTRQVALEVDVYEASLKQQAEDEDMMGGAY